MIISMATLRPVVRAGRTVLMDKREHEVTAKTHSADIFLAGVRASRRLGTARVKVLDGSAVPMTHGPDYRRAAWLNLA
jgi:hypothetical protein